MATHSYVDACEICGGQCNINQSTRPPYTSSECYDCGWWETDEEGYEGSGFMTLKEINDMRDMVEMDKLDVAEFFATRMRVDTPTPNTANQYKPDSFQSIINRRRASHE